MFNLVPKSNGSAPRFSIVCGLQEGYGQENKLHTIDEVVEVVEVYLKERAASSEPFLPGSVTAGTVVYAWSEGEGKAGSGHEPQATYSGEKNPLYHSSYTDEQITGFLNGLAAKLGEVFNQTRMYVTFDGGMWILQREDATTPTGETV